MTAFITGSRAYGTIKPNSDIDLVVLVTEETRDRLRKLTDKSTELMEKGSRIPVRFGRLNLILCTTETEYAVWKLGTEKMSQSGVRHDRIEAKKVLDELRAMVGILDQADSGNK